VLGRCLASVEAQELRGGFETIVVDNASTDSTQDVLREQADRVRVISKDHNAGFAAANNDAAAQARGDVLVLLNSDTELLAPDTLERLVVAAEEPGVGMAGPMLLNPDGTLQPSCGAHPTVTRALVVGLGLHRLLPDGARARLAPEFWSHDRARDADWVMGAAVAVRADVYRDAGGMWPILYGEEQDLAYRLQRRGLRVRFDPGPKVLHVGNHSLAQQRGDAARAERVARAELAILAAHCSRPRAAAIRAITGAAYAARAVVHRALGHAARAAVFAAMTGVYVRGR
jgi:N-acetylglucosaminyl-diphospho-decaprenol L-rhamnosyltransferase